MRIVNIIYVTFIVIPLWIITNVLWLITDILLLFTSQNAKGITWRNFKGEVAGAFIGFWENVIEVKEFY